MHGFDRNEQGKMFVGGLSWDTTKDSLLGYFSQYGEVIDCVVMKNTDTGKSRGFGFVTYRDPHCVETVLSSQVHIVDGRQVDPKACNPKGPNRGGAGGGGGRDGGGGGRVGGGIMMEGFGEEPPQRMGRGGPQGDIKDRKVFVGGLPNNADEESIKNFFSKYGNVQDVTIMYDPQKQRSRGFGFLTFENEDAVNKVCREHYVTFNGKKVECKMATPRDRRANNEGPPGPPHMGHMGPQDEPQPLLGPPHPSHIPPLDMGGQPPQAPPFQVQETQWGPPPPEPNWNQQQPPQGPPPQLSVPPQFPQNIQFQGYQGDQPPPLQPQGWSQPPPPAPAGAWAPPGAVPPPSQPQTAVSAPFMSPPSVSQTFSSAPTYQQTPSAIYQWAASPPGQQVPPNPNGQPPPTSALGQPPQQTAGYSYSTAAYGSHPVTSPPNPGLPARSYQDFANPALTARSYQDFSNGQAQIATSVAPVQPPPGPPPVSTAQTFASYTSPFAASAYAAPAYAAPAPQQVTSAPPTDPYGQSGVPAPPPQSAIQASSTPGQPTSLQGYGSAIGQPPLATTSDPAAASKATVDYSSYYSAYGNIGAQYQTESAPGYAVSTSATHQMASAVPGALPQGGASYSTPSQVQTPAVAGYGAEATQNAAAAAYGAQPAPVPAPPSAYGGQGEAQQAVAYGAPGPSPSFQRQGSATQGYHPYARR